MSPIGQDEFLVFAERVVSQEEDGIRTSDVEVVDSVDSVKFGRNPKNSVLLLCFLTLSLALDTTVHLIRARV